MGVFRKDLLNQFVHQFSSARIDSFRTTDDDGVRAETRLRQLCDDKAGDLGRDNEEDDRDILQFRNVRSGPDIFGKVDLGQVMRIRVVQIDVIANRIVVAVDDDLATTFGERDGQGGAPASGTEDGGFFDHDRV